jgi:diaminohydroxyphosphoribosylaminopyrimidine deaminase/5-amino-6-(5-phosphoribosylamino)uracil reductase
VGAIVLNPAGELAGSGWHQRFGGPHAEIHALQAAGEQARGGTLIVTLEPCSHFGKTPPCVQAVIAAGIRRVIVGCQDPAPHVNGQGIATLRAAGIEVEVGCCGRAAQQLIAPFAQLLLEQRPFMIGKWAMTLDGRIAARTGHSQWISNEQSRSLVHQLRGRVDGILVGIGTALADDPLLTPRPAGQRTPLRIVLDSKAQLPLQSQLVRTVGTTPVLLFHAPAAPPERVAALQGMGVVTCPVPTSSQGQLSWQEILAELGRRRLTNLLVEGGARILGSLWDERLLDEVHVFVAPKLVGGALAPGPVGGTGLPSVPAGTVLEDPVWQQLGSDCYLHGRVRAEFRRSTQTSFDS